MEEKHLEKKYLKNYLEENDKRRRWMKEIIEKKKNRWNIKKELN